MGRTGAATVDLSRKETLVNPATIKLIKEFEGEKLKAYLDPIGLLTVGVGHLVKKGEPYRLGQVISAAESERLLRDDLLEAETAVMKLVKVKLNDNQWGALVSFVFNLGAGNFQKSTLLKKVNARDYAGAAKEFERWNKAGGKVLAGLTRRRKAERDLFLTPVC